MTDRSAILAAVEKIYEDRNRDDIEAMVAFVHPKGKFRIAGTDRLGSLTEVADNPQAIRAIAEAFVGAWDLSGLENASVHIEGETAFVHRNDHLSTDRNYIQYRDDGEDHVQGRADFRIHAVRRHLPTCRGRGRSGLNDFTKDYQRKRGKTND